MTPQVPELSIRRFLAIASAAATLLLVTVALGLTLGFQTRAQFEEVEASWSQYANVSEKKGIWISTIRGHLGYGGIIHNFKNFVLRQDPAYLKATRAQVARFNAVMSDFLASDLLPGEADALDRIARTIAAYEAKIPIAARAAREGWAPARTDALVRVDDSGAIRALAELESIWYDHQSRSSARIEAAVRQGRQLIWIGFLSLFALVLAASVIGTLLVILVRNLRGAVARLEAELVERRRLERAQSRLAAAVEQSPATIVMTDTDARIQYVNRKFQDMTGWTLPEIIGRTPAFLQSGDAAPGLYSELRKTLSRGETWHGVFRNRCRDGSSYWAETTILPLVNPAGEITNYIGFGEDITEKRQVREQIVRAQKLEAVGQLAGGVAHDFNNILTTIVGAAHLAALDAEPDSDLGKEIGQIAIAARRAQSLVQELLTFARREPGRLQPVILSQIVDEVVNLLRASIPPTVALEVATASGNTAVLGDPTHLHQVVMNLCRNAAEALGGDEGTIRVNLDHHDRLDNCELRADGWVRLSVSDDGPGMSAQTRAHLFEPFFTTKPLGKGSGLGLSVVFGLVDEMHGHISVESTPGQGSCFTVDIPATSLSAQSVAMAAAAPQGGHEVIMVIDDEAEIAGTFRRVLLRLGYRVEAFTSPLVALERFRAKPQRYDLVISDMVMPGMSGEDLVAHIRQMRPTLPVIFCSAYYPDSANEDDTGPILMRKPVDPVQLAHRIRNLLDA